MTAYFQSEHTRPLHTFEEWVSTKSARVAYATWLRKLEIEAAEAQYNKTIEIAKERKNEMIQDANIRHKNIVEADEDD